MFRFLMPFLVLFGLMGGAVLLMCFVPLGKPPLPHALIVVGVVLMSLLVFYLNARSLLKRDPGPERLLTEGEAASAEVLAIRDTGATLNNNPLVTLTLRVRPRYGSSFQVETKTVVSRVAIPRPGDVIHVRYDPDHPQDVTVVSSWPERGPA